MIKNAQQLSGAGRVRLIRTWLIRSFTLFEVSVKCFPIISCLKCTFNSYFHLFRRKSLPMKHFELTVPNLYVYKYIYICLTSDTRVKCGIRSTLCWKIGNISGSTELLGL